MLTDACSVSMAAQSPSYKTGDIQCDEYGARRSISLKNPNQMPETRVLDCAGEEGLSYWQDSAGACSWWTS